MQTCREQGEKPIPADDAVFGYADRIGLPAEFVALARAGIPEPLLPSALNIVDSALDGLPALQTRAVWELAAAAPTAATVCALLRHALRYSQLAWKPYE